MYPPLRKGGMTFEQLRRLLQGRCEVRGLRLSIVREPWPDGGGVQRIGDEIVIYIDSGRSEDEQLRALAHETSHVLFGHYQMEGGRWRMIEAPGGKHQWEWEAKYFTQFALRARGIPPEWFLDEQLRLRLKLVGGWPYDG